jgi:hypothetical protein
MMPKSEFERPLLKVSSVDMQRPIDLGTASGSQMNIFRGTDQVVPLSANGPVSGKDLTSRLGGGVTRVRNALSGLTHKNQVVLAADIAESNSEAIKKIMELVDPNRLGRSATNIFISDRSLRKEFDIDRKRIIRSRKGMVKEIEKKMHDMDLRLRIIRLRSMSNSLRRDLSLMKMLVADLPSRFGSTNSIIFFMASEFDSAMSAARTT